MLRRDQIPRLAERLVVNELWVFFESGDKWAAMMMALGGRGYVGGPIQWRLLWRVWNNTLHRRYTSAAAIARETGLSYQTVGRHLRELEGSGFLVRDKHGWYVCEDVLARPVIAQRGRASLLDQHIAAIHRASDALRALKNK